MAKLKTTRSSNTGSTPSPPTTHQPSRGGATADRQRRRVLGVLAFGAVASACSASESLKLDGVGAARQNGNRAAGNGADAGTFGSTPTGAAAGEAGVLEIRSKQTTMVLPKPTMDASAATDASASNAASNSTTASSATPATAATTSAQDPATSMTTATADAPKALVVDLSPESDPRGTSTGQLSPESDPRKTPTGQLSPESDPRGTMTTEASKPGSTAPASDPKATTSTTEASKPGSTTPSTTPSSDQNPTSSTTEQPPAEPAPVVVAVPVAADAAFVANRITFGVSPALSNQLASLGTGGFIEDQLQRTGPDSSVESRLGGFALFGKGPKATYEALRSAKAARLEQELVHSNILRATYSRNQLYEMMCHLWMDHFNINILNNSRTRHLHVNYQEDVIRPNAMGSFRQLLRATAESPAMLNYLNNDTSNASSEQGVNENYGRELLELHTLGIDESGAQVYNEADVAAAAKAMSGWSMVTNRGAGNYSEFQFRSNYHHDGEVSLLGGAWSSQGTSGKQTGESMLDFLATHPSTARHIAYKLCRRFVSDSPPAALVASTAQVFRDNDTNLVPTLRHILRSPEFAAAAGQKFRRPFEHMVAALRAVNASVPDNPTSKGAAQLRSALTTTDHLPWGWPAPNGYPDSAAEWLDGSGLSARWTLGAQLARNRITDVRVDQGAATPQAGTVGELIAGLARRFGMGTMSQADIDAIATANRMSSGDGASSVGDAIGDVIALVLAHPIFQIR